MNPKCHYDGKRSRLERIFDAIAVAMMIAFAVAVLAEMIVE